MSAPNAAETFVVGTAGHIDHGKTSLVRALTGVDLDRTPEEKRRGITIELGFTPLRLPSGRVASFVDVPGHERLVRTMIAGACGMDAVVLCVSASEGVMPQTREHLAILGLLGVRHGLVALTMSDLVDPELAELAAEDVKDAVRGTFLEGAPVIATSALTGAGLPELTAALEALPVQKRSVDGPFRLPVDRVFVKRGFGVVVTGTVLSGRVEPGQDLVLLPGGEKLRVRGIQVHSQPAQASEAGKRTALNLSGVEREELFRGATLASPSVKTSSILDVRVSWLGEEPKSGTRLRLLSGTAEVMATVDLLGQGFAQLRTAEPVAVLAGDRFVLRRESPMTTLGGGVVLDPDAPRLRQKDHARAVEQLHRLEAGDATVFLERAGPGGLPLGGGRVGARLGDRLYHAPLVAELSEELRAALASFHASHPLALGAGRRELHRGRLAALAPAAFDALAGATDGVVVEGPRLRLHDWEVRPDATQKAALDALDQRIHSAGLEGLDAAEVTDPEGKLALLLEWGRCARVGPRVVAIAALDQLVADVKTILAAEGELNPSRFKDLTGLSRKTAIPLLEWLDEKRITVRKGETRVAR